VNRMRAAPSWMRPSAQVDLAQLGSGLRPVIRSEFAGRPDLVRVRQWARRRGLYCVADENGFFALGADSSAVRRAFQTDSRPGRHVIALGRQLGYPRCCCLAAARRLEEGIDSWAASLSQRPFVGLFKLIRPEEYGSGESLISHVPCSARCSASLAMALRLGDQLGSRRTRRPQPKVR
jgi:hypothetical protein